jgi:hypothetical protein
MFMQVVHRAQLGEVLSGRSRRLTSVIHPSDLPRLEAQSVAVIWSAEPSGQSDVPEVLVTAEGEERDWLAWLVNFMPTLRPFTAFCRVMSISTFLDLFAAFRPPTLGKVDKGCVGLILGEVLSAEEVLKLREPVTSSACASALSFALIREIAIHRNSVAHKSDLSSLWSSVRKITGQRERQLGADHVVAAAGVLEALVRGQASSLVNVRILEACRELAKHGEVTTASQPLSPAFAKLAQQMSGTREERVTAFERALGTASGNRPQEEAFALGYLASRINPGTLTHATLLVPALQHHPSAMLWYGICAGLVPESGLLSELGGIGRRVLRDLMFTDEFVSRSRWDISAAELEILVGGERSDDFPVTSPTQLSVELEPGVWTVVNWSSRARSRRLHDTGSQTEDRSWVASELEVAISRLIELHQRIHGGVPRERRPGQQSLFGQREPRGGRRHSED